MVAETFPFTWSIFHEDTLDLFNFVFPFPLYFSLSSASWRFDRIGWEISQQQAHVWPLQGGTDRNRTTTDCHGLLGKFTAESECLYQFISAIKKYADLLPEM